jgi:cobalt-zinc-cadmium efflux system outer membrane protein
LRREVTVAETVANIERLRDLVERRRVALDRFEREAASRLAALRDMAEDSYQLGRTSVLELLDAARSRHELQQNRADLTASLLQAQVRLAILLDAQLPSLDAVR